MQKKFQSFEPWSCLGSPRHNTKSKSKLHNHEDLVLNFRKPTVPKPFNLNTSLRSSKLKGIYNLRSNKQKNHSISPLQKKNLYGSLSPTHLDHLSTPDSTLYQKSPQNSRVSLRLRQITQPFDSKLTETRQIIKDEFNKYKISLKLKPMLNTNSKPKWSPTVTLNDLMNFHLSKEKFNKN